MYVNYFLPKMPGNTVTVSGGINHVFWLFVGNLGLAYIYIIISKAKALWNTKRDNYLFGLVEKTCVWLF